MQAALPTLGRVLFLAAGVALASATSSLAAPSPPSGYHGSARVLLPTQAASKYDKREGVQVVTPSAGKRRGFQSGWEADYSDVPVLPLANLVVYVYRTDADALAAYADACKTLCAPQKIPGNSEIRAKYSQPTVRTKGGLTLRCIGVFSVRLNVYAGVITCALPSYPVKSLGYDGGYLLGLVHSKAKLLS